MDALTLAYLAGAMDADGCFGIRKSTYHIRVRRDAYNAVYSERISLKQVTPEVPALLRECFGGHLYVQRPQTENSKPLHGINLTDLKASAACKALLPYLRIKRRQAESLIALRDLKSRGRIQMAYWFEQEFPHWQEMELVTTLEATAMLGHTDVRSLSQSIGNGSLLALPYDRSGEYKPRIPRLLVERIAANLGKDGRARRQCPELLAAKESLYQQVRELNKIGVNGTPVYDRTGPYALAE